MRASVGVLRIALVIASRLAAGAAVLAIVAATGPAQAQGPAPPAAPTDARVIVAGEGSVTAAPDYARIRTGVTTRAKTAKEATDANAKTMTAVMAALADSGVEQKDIQTVQFSVQPIYAPQQANTEPKLSGFSAANEIGVTVRQLGKLGDILDRLVAAGATDIGNVALLHSDPSKLLDQARTAAIADARRKAEVYAQASGLNLGGVAWVAEESGYAPPLPMLRTLAAAPTAPIAAGEDTLRVRVTVGFAVAR